MIIGFKYNEKAREGKIAVEVGPYLTTKISGCQTFWRTVHTLGGAMNISDKEIPGWNPCVVESDYHMKMRRNGRLHIFGYISEQILKNLGFDIKQHKWWYQAADNSHLIPENSIVNMVYALPGHDYYKVDPKYLESQEFKDSFLDKAPKEALYADLMEPKENGNGEDQD